MPLNSSGQISMGGSTTGQSINLELGKSVTAQISLNDSDARTLAGVASGQISISNFYGKSSLTTVLFTTIGTTTWTVPSGVTSIRITVIGGGGGGSAGFINVGKGGGAGGSGGAARGTVAVSPGNIVTVVVGQFGFRNGSQAEGSQASSATVGANTITGGAGGNGQASSNSTGGAGGTFSTSGTWTLTDGSNGSAGESGTISYGGAGGNRIAFYGLSGQGSSRDTAVGSSSPTTIASGYGAGGCGTADLNDYLGSSGTGGVVRIEYGGGI